MSDRRLRLKLKLDLWRGRLPIAPGRRWKHRQRLAPQTFIEPFDESMSDLGNLSRAGAGGWRREDHLIGAERRGHRHHH